MRIPFRLNEEGYHNCRGHRWGFNLVYNILSNPAYKGAHPKGYKMPAIIDEETWEKAQKKRREARHVRKTVHWLLQEKCVCGECGHVLSCQQKDRNERRYYGCLGRFKDTHLDGSPVCKLPRMKADLLVEWLGAIFPKERIYRTRATPVIGTYTGPGGLIVSVLGDK